MDGRTYRFPLYSTGLRPLRFPPGPLPCLLHCYYQEIPKQGKGTDDHLLPLGDWFRPDEGGGDEGRDGGGGQRTQTA